MHWDAFCAICGSTFAYSFTLPISFDDNSKLSYSKKVIGNSDLQWLSKLRALGYNASSTTERKSFITGPGQYEDQGMIGADAGKDPNFPLDDEGVMPTLFAYVNPGCPGAQVVFPFHEVCYDKILRRCFKNEVINTDVLHAVFEEKGAGAWNCLGLDYGSPQPPCGNYWECIRGQEVLVMHPTKIPELMKPPYRTIKAFFSWGKKADVESQHSHDPFQNLPNELRQKILNLLPVQCVLALKAASFSMHVCPDISLDQRLEADMPWLWEMYLEGVDLVKSQAAEGEFSKALTLMEKDSLYTEGKCDYIPGLVNRRRIWGVCEEIKRLYYEKLAEVGGSQPKARQT
ncbi:hypothetical protein N7513_010471 [Penicillium frequentans]|nr:hypothetical protein N7513_010471 [Penicillium glabrum]